MFASIANYMKAYGWKTDQTWGREVKVPPGGADALLEQGRLRAERLPRRARDDRAAAAGEVAVAGRADGRRARALPKVDRAASLLRAGKRAFLVYANYDSLLGYNCAHAYALAVGLLSDRIRR